MFDYIQFAYPNRLWLLPLALIGLAVWYFFKLRSFNPTLKVSSLSDFGPRRLTLRSVAVWIPNILNFLIVSLLIIAIARPQTTSTDEKIEKEGIDVILAMDVSGSMEACDFKPNRLEASKAVASEFIQARENDRMGIVLFSGESFTQCPLTSDRATLVNLMQTVRNGIIDDGTAIGLGLANAVARLKDSGGEGQVVMLLADGMDNCGEIEPMTAADIAATFGIRVYTIGVGTNGTAPYPVTDMFGRKTYQQMEVEIDESTLRKISEITDGKYFRATNNQTLKDVYAQIDQLEKTKMESMTISHANDLFQPFLIWALVLMVINILIRLTIGRVLP
ncbi:MAG: VWA domain-containing protein [Bacteroidales bacterium]|nr:VWA domain-containing protein [Bacteroidales bacterium]